MGARLSDPPALLSPPSPTGSILSVHSQPADTSYTLQLPKDAPHLLQPHSAPTWGTIPKLPPPGRSPLAQRPLRRQVSRWGEVGMGPGAGLSAGNPRLLMMTRIATFVLPASIHCVPVMCQTRYQGRNTEQSRSGLCPLGVCTPPWFDWRPGDQRGPGLPRGKLEVELTSLAPFPQLRAASLVSVLPDLVKGYKAQFRCLYLWPSPESTFQSPYSRGIEQRLI